MLLQNLLLQDQILSFRKVLNEVRGKQDSGTVALSSNLLAGRGEKTTSKKGQEWTLRAQLGQLKTGQDGKGLLPTHL